MAYAQLAGLPAYFRLYASFLPPLIAALFGPSRQLATGSVAVVSLMTAARLEPLAAAGSEGFIAYGILLALIVRLFQFTLGALRSALAKNKNFFHRFMAGGDRAPNGQYVFPQFYGKAIPIWEDLKRVLLAMREDGALERIRLQWFRLDPKALRMS
jgi:hypothetical protein